MKRTLFSALLIPIVSHAGWFGPSNFQDCVLEGMKGVSSDQAANAITAVCRQKFPHTPTEAEKQAAKEPAKRYGTPRINLWDGNAGINIVNRVKIGTWSGSSISVTNRNSFTLNGIYVGVPSASKEKTCATSADSYREIHFCSGSAGPNLTGKFNCKEVPASVSFCLTGVMGAYESDLDEFFRSQGF